MIEKMEIDTQVETLTKRHRSESERTLVELAPAQSTTTMDQTEIKNDCQIEDQQPESLNKRIKLYNRRTNRPPINP